jgi:hypothetical protein
MLDQNIDPKSAAYQTLFEARTDLQKLAADLLDDDLDAQVSGLADAATDLTDLITKMKAADAKLTAVATYVEEAAKAIGILVQIINLAAKLA